MEKYEGVMGRKSRSISILFFIFGLIGALGFRIILLLSKINSLFASVAWYIAIIAYLFFYSYRFYIEDKRRKIIISNRLREKLLEEKLGEEDIKKIKTLLDSILVSKLNWNFLILLILTVVALMIQIIVDVIFGF